MAINPDQPLVQGDFNYRLGNPAANSAWNDSDICVMAGDRIQLVSMAVFSLTSGTVDVVPDGTANMGAGYLPHWVYKPKWARKEDIHVINHVTENQRWAVDRGFRALNGNIGAGPVIRVDLEDLYCPWDGTVTVEGGSGPSSAPTSCVITISYLWDQTRRLNRYPVDTRVKYKHTLSFVNAFNESTAFPVNRPVRADQVWCPSNATGTVLILDNGPGSTQCQVTVNGEDGAAQLCSYTRVTALNQGVPQIVFGIPL